MPMRSTALDEPCSRVFDVTKEELARTRRLASTPIKREKRRKEKERETWVGLDGRKKRMRDEASMLYLSADVGQGRTAGFQLYRYLSGDNDRMAIAGVAVPQPSEVGWIHKWIYPLRSIIHPVRAAHPDMQPHATTARVHTVERKEMLESSITFRVE